MSTQPVNSNTPVGSPSTMSRHAWTWDLPLLTKELIELSVRPRTYQIRGAYAVLLLMLSFLVLCWIVPSYSGSPLNVFGVGATILKVIQYLQAYGLYIIVPVLACGTLTVEKERKSLDLLLITRLGPGTIILEKFLSRFVPALNFILVSAPILAFCYALGGIDSSDVLSLIKDQVLVAIRLTSVGVMCSAVFRTTSRALVGTYLFLVLAAILEYFGIRLVENVLGINQSSFILSGSSELPFDAGIFVIQITPWLLKFVNGVISLAMSGLCLLVGRHFLMRTSSGGSARVSVRNRYSLERQPRNPKDIPAEDPIAWSERPWAAQQVWWWTNRICGIAAMSALLFLFSLRQEQSFVSAMMTSFIILVWLIVTLWICIYASGQIVQERTRQTLDVLLTTPLTGEQIVRQKMARVGRIIQLGRFSLLSCVLIATSFRWSTSFLVNSALMIWLYPQVIAWQAMVCGLPVKNSVWAILKSLLVIVARCLLPYLLIIVLAIFSNGRVFSGEGTPDFVFFLACLSPLTLLIAADQLTSDGIEHFALIGPFVTVVANGILLVYLQYKATQGADKFLGRMTPPDPV